MSVQIFHLPGESLRSALIAAGALLPASDRMTPFKNVSGEPILRLDDAARASAASDIAAGSDGRAELSKDANMAFAAPNARKKNWVW